MTETSAVDTSLEAVDEVDEAALAEVMRVVPLGAGVLAGGAVALLVLGYLAIYLLIFLPRGVVGLSDERSASSRARAPHSRD